MEEGQQSNTTIQPHNLKLYPKEESMAHKRHKGATEILDTPKTQSIPPEKALETKYQLPVAKQLAQQTNNKPQSKHSEEKTKIKRMYRV